MGILDFLNFSDPSGDENTDRESEQSPYFQLEETGQPAENDGERDAREDYNQEREESNSDPIPEDPPDWAKGLPNPSDFK